MTAKVTSPVPSDLPVDDDTVIDLSGIAGDTDALARWRAKRLADLLFDAMQAQHGEGAQMAQINVFSAGLTAQAVTADGEPCHPTIAVDPNLSPGIDANTGYPHPGEPIRTIHMEQGHALSYDRRDESAKPLAYPDMKTALARTLQRPEGAHLGHITTSMIVHMEMEKFDRKAEQKATMPMPGVYQ